MAAIFIGCGVFWEMEFNADSSTDMTLANWASFKKHYSDTKILFYNQIIRINTNRFPQKEAKYKCRQ